MLKFNAQEICDENNKLSGCLPSMFCSNNPNGSDSKTLAAQVHPLQSKDSQDQAGSHRQGWDSDPSQG